jgi:hypothetical protein
MAPFCEHVGGAGATPGKLEQIAKKWPGRWSCCGIEIKFGIFERKF